MKPKVVASECCAGLHPQNTLRGFQFCLDSGVEGIEFDVHLSRDGEVVVQHDYRLNKRITRDSSGLWLEQKGAALCDVSLAELDQFDVGRYLPGSYEAETYPNYQPADGERIPTLKQLLHAHKASASEAELWIELKTSPFDRDISAEPTDLLAAVLQLVKAFDVVDQTILLAFEWQLLVDAIRFCPGIGTDFLTINPAFIRHQYRSRDSINPEDLYQPFAPSNFEDCVPAAIVAASGHWWGPYAADVTVEDIQEAQEFGLKVNVWGVDSSDAAIEEALQLQTDAITISDSTLLQRRLE